MDSSRYSSTVLQIEYFSPADESFVGEIDLYAYDLATINAFCPPEIADDPHYCNGTFIEKESFSLLQEYIDELKSFVYEEYIYNIITRGIY
ncbi:hypothetical protein [Fluviicola sp.]|uniref:hypothetical protein n=1 Tax=Fluviicola sp. TaxID=1917219 RepID=UPI0031D74D60